MAGLDGLSLFPGATSTAFSVAAWVKFASTGTQYQFRNIVRKTSFITFQLNTLTGSAQKQYAVRYVHTHPCTHTFIDDYGFAVWH
jgi:hypothetical protein